MKTFIKRKWPVIRLLLFLLPGILQPKTHEAQVNFAVDISETYDDNIFLSVTPQRDFLSDASLGIYFQPKDSALNFQFHSNYFAYATNSERNLLMNKIHFSYYIPLDTAKTNSWNVGGNWSDRINSDIYNYYNYNQLYGYTSFFFKLNETRLKTGYNIRYRDFANYPDISNLQQYLYIQAHRSFPSRTTLILEANLGMKTFQGEDSVIQVDSSGKYHNQGLITIEGENINLVHLLLMGRVAQSLHDRVGLYVQYNQQISLIEKGSYLNGSEFYQDEELFDDPFSYENSEIISRLSIMLPNSFSIETGPTLSYKNYLTEKAYLSASDTLALGSERQDTKFSYSFNLDKKFNIKKTSRMKSCKLYARYSFVSNTSNSYWYNYKYNALTIGLSATF